MKPKRVSKQKIAKLIAKKCYFCPENDYNLLDSHRILPGESGGTYHSRNVVVVCCKCHRKIHSGRIKIFGKYLSTNKNGFVVGFIEDGVEKWM